ncbi:hypothetical protein FA13DRAFT_1823267 [Coprinellus micaceus]|uniref:Fungal-type protein kinase domain-containing protein n=1 Tax=Coprinellus micaceus TaxID=71717 RepID=A0A4Y7S0A4_COPMI|nr:hypothetical protein FA13DRAFT_1823267 [Coprinellus micaceus]
MGGTTVNERPGPSRKGDTTGSRHRGFTTTSEEYGHDVYRKLVRDRDVEAFLGRTKTFDLENKQWSLPQASSFTEQLVTSAFKIIRTVLARLVQPTQIGVERDVRNVLKDNSRHPKNEHGYDFCPHLVVRASGPSFESPTPVPGNDSAATRPGLAYINIASFVTVKHESQVGNIKEVLKEMEFHSGEIFKSQPNRLYVRSILLTEKHARLVHFDRAGIQTTPPINIHQNPATLIRLILGISSTNEWLLGLDDSVQWEIVDGQKGTGTLTTTDVNGATKAYTIVELLPVLRDSIRGRGTTCWRVQDPDTSEVFVVKDSWRPEDRPAEYEFLEHAQNIPGVAHMVSYEPGRCETARFRCSTTVGQYYNRAATRMVLKSYGRPISSFTSILEVLCAIRDAIAGHQRLLSDDIRILHRDISHNNILLGLDGASDGDRGVLIDLEMAFRSTDANPRVKVDYTIGTRLFQSIRVLDSYYPMGFHPDHDHLDELESFFYVLTYVLLLFRPDGSLLPSDDKGPSIVWSWGSDDPDTANMNKRDIYEAEYAHLTALRLIQETWHPACATLFKEFRLFVIDIISDKTTILAGADERADRNLLQPLLSHRDSHYAKVLEIFDKAIDAIKGTATTNSVRVSGATPAAAARSGVDEMAPGQPCSGKSPCPVLKDCSRPSPASPEARSSAGPTPALNHDKFLNHISDGAFCDANHS